jgi:hypothetical protein
MEVGDVLSTSSCSSPVMEKVLEVALEVATASGQLRYARMPRIARAMQLSDFVTP